MLVLLMLAVSASVLSEQQENEQMEKLNEVKSQLVRKLESMQGLPANTQDVTDNLLRKIKAGIRTQAVSLG